MRVEAEKEPTEKKRHEKRSLIGSVHRVPTSAQEARETMWETSRMYDVLLYIQPSQ